MDVKVHTARGVHERAIDSSPTRGENPNIAVYIDPPSRHFLRDRLFNADDGRLNGDRVNAPYTRLREQLAARGISVHTIDFLPARVGQSRNIYFSMGTTANYRRLSRRPDIILSAFFAMECPIVDPVMYRELKHAQNDFKRIYSWSDSASLERFVGGSLRCLPFRWPQSFDAVHEPIWCREQRKFLVMINGNKLPAISWQELYTERMRAVEFFGRTGEIDLYGIGWDGPPYRVGPRIWLPYVVRRAERQIQGWWQRVRPDPLLEAARRAYHGPTQSKAETLGQYTFALCFENMILPGWLTEKMFDCFFAGTVPVYWGAPDVEKYVPKHCFIDMREFSGYPQLRDHLRSLGTADVRQYKEGARDYLKSAQFRPSSTAAFVELFNRIIDEDASALEGSPEAGLAAR
jgi:hypothetical protein